MVTIQPHANIKREVAKDKNSGSANKSDTNSKKKKNEEKKIAWHKAPLEESIKKFCEQKKLKPFWKQILTNISNLATAYAVSDSADAFNISPYLNLPASFGFMHFTNKGKKDMDKLFWTTAVGVSAVFVQKIFRMPKWILKTLISGTIFSINNKKLNFPMCLMDKSRFKATKKDIKFLLKKLFKIESVIHSIPNLVSPIVDLGYKKFVKENNSISKYPLAVGLYACKVLGLSTGFVFFGNLMHKWLKMGGKGDMEGLTNMLIGACPAEIASSTKAIMLPDAA